MTRSTSNPFPASSSSSDWFRREMMNFFRDFDRSGRRSATRSANVFPPVNIYDDGEAFLVRAEAPGVDGDEIDLSAKGDQLTIRGERTIADVDADASYHRRERKAGTFRRTVTMPEPVDPDGIQARFTHGVLEVYAPRAEEARPRTIDVTRG